VIQVPKHQNEEENGKNTHNVTGMAHSVLYKFGAPDSLRVHHSLGTRATIQRDENCACARIRDISSCTASCKSGRQNLSGRNKK